MELMDFTYQPFSQKPPSQMFDWVLNTPLMGNNCDHYQSKTPNTDIFNEVSCLATEQFCSGNVALAFSLSHTTAIKEIYY